jgi:phosphomevalonate kinase
LARLSVPGNILLLGEYAVLEEGGLGLAMAVDRRISVETSAHNGLLIEGSWQGRVTSWTRESVSENPVAAAAVQVVESWLSSWGLPMDGWNTRLSIDSSPFFADSGGKIGLGSSAAVAIGLVCGLLAASTAPEAARSPDVLRLALEAHRNAQGGSGSGYDVSCSFHGGIGLFRGGAEPSWEPCTVPTDPVIILFQGPRPVLTREAVKRFFQWKKRNPGPARRFLVESNRAILDFVRAGSQEEALLHFNACRQIGISLGDAIGFPAHLSVPRGLDPAWCKAVGAGNELAACLLPRSSPLPASDGRVLRVLPSEKGVLWEE